METVKDYLKQYFSNNNTDTSKYSWASYVVLESESLAKVCQFTFGGILSPELAVGLLMLMTVIPGGARRIFE